MAKLTMKHGLIGLAALLVLPLGAALAQQVKQPADPMPDRSKLSYEDNVSVNAACFGSLKKGGDHDGCIKAQVAALATHPTPDFKGLSDAHRRDAERECANFRPRGVVDYNDCLGRSIAGIRAANKAAEEGAFNRRKSESRSPGRSG